jgi:putative phosphoesterase
MKIAVMSDIHGNLNALNAVFQDIPRDIDITIVCGDTVGYGPKPMECTEKVMEKVDICITGNHEDALIEGRNFNSTTARFGLKHAKEHLHSKHFKWIESLRNKISTSEYLIFHSHPEPTINDHIYPEDIENQLASYFDENRIIMYGHTHTPVIRKIKDCLVVNPGSVGQPRDGNNDASYAILHSEELEAEIKRVDYSIQDTIRNMEKFNFPAESRLRIRNAE